MSVSARPMPLVITGVTKRFGDRLILHDRTLHVDPGEAVVLRGPNGSGKSTLLGCICGLVIPDSGEIAIAGRDLEREPLAARSKLRALSQEIEVPPGLTGRELLAFFADVHRDPAGAEQAATFTELGDALDRLATTYSVGMRRLLAFACLLPGESSLWVLDEPFAGIDEQGRARMLDAISRVRSRGVGVLLAAHDRDAPELSAMQARTIELAPLPAGARSSALHPGG